MRGLKCNSSCSERTTVRVAPRIGVRGLKLFVNYQTFVSEGRTSYWGAWIEIELIAKQQEMLAVAPRIGVRGLK